MDEFELMLEEIRQATMQKLKDSNIQIDEEKINNFKGIILELDSLRNEYEGQFSSLRTITEKEIVNIQYSKGGEAIHKGFYCPSPVLDLIVGVLKEGSSLKENLISEDTLMNSALIQTTD